MTKWVNIKQIIKLERMLGLARYYAHEGDLASARSMVKEMRKYLAKSGLNTNKKIAEIEKDL